MYSMLAMLLLVIVADWLDARLDWQQEIYTKEMSS